MHFRSLPRTEGWAGGPISAKHCWSLNELKTSGKAFNLQEIGSELESGWLSLKASKKKHCEQNKTGIHLPDKFWSTSYSHFEVVAPDCFIIAVQQARMNGLSTSEACANVRTTWQETRIGSDWLVGDDITARTRDVCIISSQKIKSWCGLVL